MWPLTVLLTMLSLVTAACSSSTLSTTTPTAPKCAVSASTTAAWFPAAGGTGTISVQTTRDCTWNAASEVSWILPDHTQGQGPTNLSITVAANTTPTHRVGALVLESARVEIAQEGVPCRFDLDQDRVEIGSRGGSARLQVRAAAGCSWTARSETAWIIIRGNGSLSGTDGVELTIAANSGSARQGVVSIAGKTAIVVQHAADSSPTPGPTPPPPGGRVELDGRISSVGGGCPNVTFALRGANVYADRATEYHKGDCRDVEEGRQVVVEGRYGSDGRVLAERIHIKKGK